jgi:hypothetical protein
MTSHQVRLGHDVEDRLDLPARQGFTPRCLRDPVRHTEDKLFELATREEARVIVPSEMRREFAGHKPGSRVVTPKMVSGQVKDGGEGSLVLL